MGIAVVVEPKLSVDDKSRTDGNFYLSSCSSQIDVSVVHPSAKSYRRAASKPLGAALGREKLKNNLYLERAQANGSKFYPLSSSLMGQLVLEHGNSFACLMMKQVLIQSTTYMGFLLQTLFSALWRLFYKFLTVFYV